MKVLKKLSPKLSKSQKDTLEKRFFYSDIKEISLEEWEEMHEGQHKAFVKKLFRFMLKVILFFLKSRLESKLSQYYNQIFKEFGVPANHLETANSLKRELRLRCDAVIKNDKTLSVLANIEKETRETRDKDQKKPRSFQQLLTEINISRSTRYTMKGTNVKEFYTILETVKNG